MHEISNAAQITIGVEGESLGLIAMQQPCSWIHIASGSEPPFSYLLDLSLDQGIAVGMSLGLREDTPEKMKRFPSMGEPQYRYYMYTPFTTP